MIPVAASAGRHKAAMPFIMVVVLIDMLSIGLILPVLPPLVGEFTADAAEQSLWYGVLTFSFALATFIGAPLLGALSDRFGRRPVLLVGFGGLALNFVGTALASTLWMLVGARIVSGFMQANAAVANAYVADISPPDQRARRFGLLGAMFGIGFILGPVMGGLLGGIELRLPFWVAAALTGVNFVYGLLVLPESLPRERRRDLRWRSANPVTSLKQLAALRGVGRLVAVIACAGLAQYTLYTTWVLYTTLRFGWGPAENGWSLFAVGLVSALVQGGLMGRLLKRFTPQRLTLLGLASSTLAFAGWGAATAGWVMYAVIVANLLGNTVAAAINGIVSGAADARSQGGTLGAVSSLNGLMAVIAPAFGASLLAIVSHLPPGDWRLGAPMYFCAALQGGALWLAWSHFRRQRAAQPAHPSPVA